MCKNKFNHTIYLSPFFSSFVSVAPPNRLTPTSPTSPTPRLRHFRHHWLVSDKTTPLNANLSAFSHLLAAYRQTSLLAVDDVVGDIKATLEQYPSRLYPDTASAGSISTATAAAAATTALDDTYVIYTSDHGYALGQLRLTSGERLKRTDSMRGSELLLLLNLFLFGSFLIHVKIQM
jgi:hypothetical protein